MAIQSKPVRVFNTCYEVGHCWTPHCVEATTDVAKSVFTEAVKIYGALYMVTALFKKKGLKYYMKKFIPETLQSTIFLTVNGTLFVTFFCLWRRLKGYYTFYDAFILGTPASAAALLIERRHRRVIGSFYFINLSYLPAFCAAATAIVIERKNRRSPLAIYISNLAVETGFRMLMNRGIVKPVPHGEVLLFSITSAVYLYLFRRKNGLPKSTLSVFNFLLGKEENPDWAAKDANDNSTSALADVEGRAPLDPSAPGTTPDGEGNQKRRSLMGVLLSSARVKQVTGVLCSGWEKLVTLVKTCPSHCSCPHAHSCLHYVLTGLVKMFSLGYAVQLLVKLLSSLGALKKKPSEVKSVLWGPGSLGLAAFLGLYSAVFRGVNCALRWMRQKDHEFHGAVAGFLAGGAMYFYKSITVALFCSAKLMEVLYFKGIEAGKLPYIPNAEVFIYAVNCALVFHAAVLEPHSIRPAYWKWLQRVTHNRFAYMNRHLLDVFGTNASKMFPDFWPNYDPKYTDLVRPVTLTSTHGI